MLKVVTAETIVEQANKLPMYQFDLKRPWWWLDTQENYNSRKRHEIAAAKSFKQKFDEAINAINEASPQNIQGWIQKNWKITVVGIVAIILFLKD